MIARACGRIRGIVLVCWGRGRPFQVACLRLQRRRRDTGDVMVCQLGGKF
jgi:hypothetical protein